MREIYGPPVPHKPTSKLEKIDNVISKINDVLETEAENRPGYEITEQVEVFTRDDLKRTRHRNKNRTSRREE